MTKDDLIQLIRLLSAVETLLSFSDSRSKIPDFIWDQIESFTDKATKEINK